MLIVRSIGPGAAGYYLDGRHPGRWSEGAGRLLGLEGPVEGPALRSVLRGRHPLTGVALPARAGPRRRAGWDLIFAAPKSLSVLASRSEATMGDAALDAHDAAVEGVMARVAAGLTVWRDGDRSAGAEGLVAATFIHRHNAAAEPHIHSHVLVANLTRAGTGWCAVGNEEWFVNRRALAALYQLELRHRLAERGWQLDWRLRPDGLADLADVPREVIRATSTQGRRVVEQGRFDARRRAQPSRWRERAAAAGIDRVQIRPADSPSPGAPAQLAGETLERAVTSRLSGRRSDFRRADVIVAVAACHPGGAPAAAVDEWVDRFCRASHPVRSPTRRPRWTTGPARRADDELQSLLDGHGRLPPARAVPDGAVRRGVQALGDHPPSAISVARDLTQAPTRLAVLGAPPGRSAFLAQADVLEACAAIWEAAGLRSTVDSPTSRAAQRWQVLAGLDPHRRGDRPDVLVVDQADRRTTTELLALADTFLAPGGRLILVEGGTMPRLSAPSSLGLIEAADRHGRWDPGAHVPWSGDDPPGGRLAGRRWGRAAAEALMRAWRQEPPGERSLLVGLGVDEVIGLNRAARLALDTGRRDVGPLPVDTGRRDSGPEPGAGAGLRAGPGPEGFRAGDRVVLLRGGTDHVPYGSFGTLEQSGRAPVVRWDSGAATDPRRLPARALGLGWAVTEFVAARRDGPVLLLGPPRAARGLTHRLAWSHEAGPEPPSRQLGR